MLREIMRMIWARLFGAPETINIKYCNYESWPSGGIGRRWGLKIPCPLWAYGFESHLGYFLLIFIHFWGDLV